MTRGTKIALAAAGAAALVVGGGGAALAASDALSPKEESQAVIDDAAKQLGVEPSELSDALKQALENRIDAAVEQGRLTEEQGQKLKQRLESADTPLVFPWLGVAGHGPWHGHFGPFATLDAAASYLGLSEAELRAKLLGGKSLAEVAKEQGKSVDGLVQALVKASKERIDRAVQDGKLTESQANELKANLEQRVRDLVNHEPGMFGRFGRFGPFGGGHHFGQRHFGPGFGFDREMPFGGHLAGPRA